MGLDMDLSKYHKDTKLLSCEDVDNECGICNGCQDTIVANWRKANQIHRWFVKNVQNGLDDCKSYEVNIGSLMVLRNLCEMVLLKKYKACDILPTQEGFFFGSTEYDDLYFEQIKKTKEQLDSIIEKHKDIYKYVYSSSW